MATMAIEVPRYPAPLMPLTSEWTVDDLADLPDDGLRYELIDGALLVSPAPVPAHQRAARGLFLALHAQCPAGWEVFFAPIGFRPDRHTSLEPDLLVVRSEDVGRNGIERPLLLAVEVLSRATRRRDLLMKRSVYEEFGVRSYWMFDPDRQSLVVYELAGGRYVEKLHAVGAAEVQVDLPYPLRLCPAELASG
jgi:Uma2 family endonuclease